MPLAFLLLGGGVVLVWSALSGQGAWSSITSVLKGETVDTKLPDSEMSAVSLQTGTAPDAIPSGGPAPSTNGLDPFGHSVADLQTYAKALLQYRGWGGQWDSFNKLVMGESGWRWNARNPGMTGYLDEKHAYGIPQALPPAKMASAGADWKTNGYTQLRWMMDYIKSSYGDPNNALAKWTSRNPHWY